MSIGDPFPENLKPDATVDGRVISLIPIPMNSGEHFNVKIVLGAEGKVPFDVSARISGVKKITVYKPDSRLKFTLNALSFVTFTSLGAIILGGFIGGWIILIGAVSFIVSLCLGITIATIDAARNP